MNALTPPPAEAVPAPVGLLAELTHRCPLRCPYCSNPLELDRRSGELDTATWLRVLDEAAALGVLHVHLSGGEPTARNDIVEITKRCADLGLYSNLITSGVGGALAKLDALYDADLDPETLVIRTDVPNLSVLPAGAKTAMDTELLASARTRAVIARLLAANPRRLVIFDSPPALAASPAAVLAMLVGQVMLVVRADRTPDSEVQAAVQVLDGCDHIGLVLNAVSFVPDRHRFGSYYGQELTP